MSEMQLKDIVYAALLAAGEPLTLDRLGALFDEDVRPDREVLRAALGELEAALATGPVELQCIDKAYRLQTRIAFAPWLRRLSAERPPKYSRATLETLAIIAYRQPVTRGEIEAIRGVAVSSEILKTLMQREWIRQVGTKEVPGRPALFGTTRVFLEYFSLTSLADLPPLADLRAERIPGETADDTPEDAGAVAADGDAEQAAVTEEAAGPQPPVADE